MMQQTGLPVEFLNGPVLTGSAGQFEKVSRVRED
jgi:hypothetical protein